MKNIKMGIVLENSASTLTQGMAGISIEDLGRLWGE